MKTLNDFDFNNKKALIRVDFNVPLDENFNVTDATRIEAAKPTIDKVLADGGSVILMSHLGRPKGKEDKYSLKYILRKASEILGKEVKFAEDCRGEVAKNAAENLNQAKFCCSKTCVFMLKKKPVMSLSLKNSRHWATFM